MSNLIQIHYGELEQIAAHFENQADSIQQLLQTVRSRADSLHGDGWIGDAADSFFREMNEVVLPSVGRLQSALEQASQIIKQVASDFQQAEEDSRGLFL